MVEEKERIREDEISNNSHPTSRSRERTITNPSSTPAARAYDREGASIPTPMREAEKVTRRTNILPFQKLYEMVRGGRYECGAVVVERGP